MMPRELSGCGAARLNRDNLPTVFPGIFFLNAKMVHTLSVLAFLLLMASDSPPPAAGVDDDAVMQRLAVVANRHHGARGLSEQERQELDDWLREHRDVVLHSAENRVRQYLGGEGKPYAPHRFATPNCLFSAVIQSEHPEAGRMFKRLFKIAQLRLEFTDMLFRSDAPVQPSSALGLETYRKVLSVMSIRDATLHYSAQVESTLLIDEAVPLLEAGMSTRVYALRYLMAVWEQDEKAQRALAEAYDNPDSWLFHNELIKPAHDASSQ